MWWLPLLLVFLGSLAADDNLADVLCPEESGIPSYCPAFMVVRGSEFGNQQDDYLARAQNIIRKSSEKIREAVQKERDLSECFFQIFQFLALERRQLAIDHHTVGSDQFGARRDLEGCADFSYTPFIGGYSEYGKQILTFLKEALSTMPREGGQFLEKTWLHEETFLGKRSSVEIQIFDKDDLKREKWHEGLQETDLPQWFPAALLKEPPKDLSGKKTLFQALRQLRLTAPEKYSHLRMGSLLMLMMNDFPSPMKAGKLGGPMKWVGNLNYLKSFYVLCTVRLEIQGNMEPLFQYITWGYQNPDDPEEDPCERMARCSEVVVVHQHESLIQKTLDDASPVFAKAVQWNGKNIVELQELIALLRLELICMPFLRGSAATSEWMEAAIYEFHKLRYTMDRNRLTDLEAYSNPYPSQFFNAYTSYIKVSR
ncbi:MAG: hypothetical protein KGQ49_03920 [Verrucomicrobia bacterium]|nr:hypothetical protein [Verrucomicrobiota bacterium]